LLGLFFSGHSSKNTEKLAKSWQCFSFHVVARAGAHPAACHTIEAARRPRNTMRTGAC